MTGPTAGARPGPAPLLLATRSTDKAREVREILAPLVARPIRTLDELGIPPADAEDHIEIHDTFRANAIAKAEYFARLTALTVLSDDSGIAVDALGGEPGVRSRRFSGRPDLAGPDLDAANNARLLDRLRGVPQPRRSAHYLCAAALLAPGRTPAIALGAVSGLIAPAPDGRHGFGYDPLFLFPPLGLTFGRLSPRQKHDFSHRGRAFRALAAVCADQLRG